MEDRLLFLIGSPRSGSTLLSRMIGAHSEIHAPSEPHLITPIAHLGYFASVEKAPYDPIITRAAIQELIGQLPGGEDDYLRALRSYTDAVYESLAGPSGRLLLLDKTPAYALVLDFLVRLYPNARYVVLTRNPMAVWSSFVQSFFDGDHAVAHDHNPLMERYVPAVARFVREAKVPLCHVQYEELVTQPEVQLQRICDLIGVGFEPGMVEYGKQPDSRGQDARGLGDPVSVARESRPTTKSLSRWTETMAGDASKVEQARQILARLADEDLVTWGFGRRDLEEQLDSVPAVGGGKARGLSRYALERRLVVALRRNIHHNALGRLVRKLRHACDILLR